jgi:5,5'-dehydrodivanillate O-demethylase
VIREPHDRIDLPCEKDKFGARWEEFAVQWITQGFARYSPQRDGLVKLHLDAAALRDAHSVG